MTRITRRQNRDVSSTATRVYQAIEWALVLSTFASSDFSISNIPRSCSVVCLSRWLYQESWSWQVLLIVTIITMVTTYEARSKWMSLLLYVVIFPTSLAYKKCSSSLHPSLSDTMFATNVEISVVSYLHAFLPYFRPLGQWTAQPDTLIAFSGYILSPSNPFISLLHLQIIKTGRVLAGSSLNTIELSLLSHSLTIFTVYYLNHGDGRTLFFPESFFFAFIWGLLLAFLPAVPFIQKNVRLAKMKPQYRPKNAMKQRYTFALHTYITIAAVLLTAVRFWLQKQLGQDPFVFVLAYLLASYSRLFVVLYWISMATLGIIVVIYFWGSKPVGGLSGFPISALRLLKHSRSQDIHQTTDEDDVFFEEEDTLARRARALDRRRKFFHGLVVVLFLPTLNRDPALSYLALSLALTGFIFEEVIRATALPPFGFAIHKFLSGFTDHRDKTGHLVVSHLFLLIGVAAPVWLSLTGELSGDISGLKVAPHGSIAMLSGVLTLGAGDAAASIIGKKYGRHKWPTLPKSIEGTAAFILAMMFGGYTTVALSSGGADIPWKRFTASVLATGMMEAVSTQNDNLVIPMFMWSLVYREQPTI